MEATWRWYGGETPTSRRVWSANPLACRDDDFRPAIAPISQDMGRRLAMTATMISGVTLDGVVQAPARTRTPGTGSPTAAGQCPTATRPRPPRGAS
jgi:hypothetical protein